MVICIKQHLSNILNALLSVAYKKSVKKALQKKVCSLKRCKIKWNRKR